MDVSSGPRATATATAAGLPCGVGGDAREVLAEMRRRRAGAGGLTNPREHDGERGRAATQAKQAGEKEASVRVRGRVNNGMGGARAPQPSRPLSRGPASRAQPRAGGRSASSMRPCLQRRAPVTGDWWGGRQAAGERRVDSTRRRGFGSPEGGVRGPRVSARAAWRRRLGSGWDRTRHERNGALLAACHVGPTCRWSPVGCNDVGPAGFTGSSGHPVTTHHRGMFSGSSCVLYPCSSTATKHYKPAGNLVRFCFHFARRGRSRWPSGGVFFFSNRSESVNVGDNRQRLRV